MPISPPPVRAWRPEYLPASLSTGWIGLRAGPIPLIEGLAVVNGLAAIDPVGQGEGFARGPYPIGGEVEGGGCKVRRFPEHAHSSEPRHDSSRGAPTSRFDFHGGDATASVDVLTFCSRTL